MSAPQDHRPAGAFSDPNLMRRVASGLVMAVIALVTAWAGGPAFLILWVGAALVVLWEWNRLVDTRHDPVALVCGGAIVCLGSLVFPLSLALTVTILGMATLFVLNVTFEKRVWAIAGVGYAFLLAFATVALRADPDFGFAGIIWLFAIVWGTDVGAYFAGRTLGGPKLWPRLSPKKTWSGFVGGTVAGTLIALALVRVFAVPVTLPLVLLTYGLAALSQGGDLLESAIKRKFGAKDASGLIPGHGGVMDRLDAFVVAVNCAAALGLARGGLDHVARGILIW